MLSKLNMLKKLSKRYSILVVSRDDTSINKLEIKRSHLGLGLAVCLAIIAGLLASLGGMLHFWKAFEATEDLRVKAANFQQESSRLFAKIHDLDDILDRTARLSARVESVFEKNQGLQSAKGPIDEEDWRATLEASQEYYRFEESKWRLGDLNFELDNLKKQMMGTENALNAVFVAQKERLFFWSSIPSIWPVKGWITSKFGIRSLYSRRTGGRSTRWHEGIDIAAPRGTPIQVSADGIVTYVGYRSGYGQTIKIDHGNGLSTIYAHCSSIFVKEGSSVERGMVIAAVGNTGRSTGPHLHYEVRIDDVPVDPMNYVVGDM
ncbi:MAG: M23 family metallopeptidase [Pseudomonadota bacterium]